MKKIILGLLATASFLLADGCWTTVQKSNGGFDELNDNITFSIKNAVNCKPVKDATINFGSVTLRTNYKGEFSVPLDVLEDGQKIDLQIAKKGYIPFKKRLEVTVGTIFGTKILVSPKLAPTSVRFVLSWDAKPTDLDIHLVTDDFHVSYRHKRNIAQKAKLDRDAMNGYGAETITLLEVKEDIAYKVFVKRFSHAGKIDGKAEIQVYVDNKLAKIVKLVSTSKKAVEVLKLFGGEITYINKGVDAVR